MGNFESHSTTAYGVDLSQLSIDQVYVFYNSKVTQNASWIYSLTSQCYKCLPQLQLPYPVVNGQQAEQPLSIRFDTDLYVGPNDQGTNLSSPCTKEVDFREFGIYNCSISENEDKLLCHCEQLREGSDIFWPILCAIAFFLGLAGLYLLSLFIYRWKHSVTSATNSSSDLTQLKMTSIVGVENVSSERTEADMQPSKSKAKGRVKAIDTLRGMSICAMIFYNYGGGGYWFFDHVPWNGLTCADLVFPWFMWTMGVCIPISVRSLIKRKGTKTKSWSKIIKRSLWLFLLGLAISNINNLNIRVVRIFGVLQRFSITYLIVASFHLLFHRPSSQMTKSPGSFDDVKTIAYEWLVQIGIVTTHLLITFLLPVPGCPTGYLGPGGRNDGGKYFNCTGGAAGYIDRLILGAHCYQNPTSKSVYGGTVAYDPEGILGTLQASFQVFLGLQAGMTMLTFKGHRSRLTRWLTWGTITGALAAILCLASANEGWIPINKNLWSFTFVLATSSFAFILLSFLYAIIDVLKWWNGSPFFYPGMNSIVLYLGHEITTAVFPFQWADSENAASMQTHGYQLALDLWVVTLWAIIAFWLHSIKFFVAL
ncbi:hypothetical protein CHUAL_008587 [Chamberlinius hualienensis]